MSDKRGSSRETVIAGATTLVAGALYINADTNAAVVNPSAQTATSLATALGASALKKIDLPARVGAHPDTGLPIFEVL